MIEPKRASFYVYAETDGEVADLESELYRFVSGHYAKGTLVTAKVLSGLLKRFGSNPMVKTLFNNGN